MAFKLLVTISAFLVIIQCRDISKTIKSIPTISNSLVNLGKVDISFYINTKDSGRIPDSFLGPSSSYLFSKSEPVEEPCPCSSLRNFKEPLLSNPSDILNKILMSNDLFSRREPTSSTLCCDSHEHDEFITVDFAHKTAKPALNNLRGLPVIFEKFLSKNALMHSSKPKAVEILLFPNKKENIHTPLKNDSVKKESIQIVGDKELRNDFKSVNLEPPLPVVSSVKKDLTAQKFETKKPIEKEEFHFSVVPNGNAII